jgi:hypothetical protein
MAAYEGLSFILYKNEPPFSRPEVKIHVRRSAVSLMRVMADLPVQRWRPPNLATAQVLWQTHELKDGDCYNIVIALL